MNGTEEIHVLKEEVEKLRDKLNKDVTINFKYMSKDKYKNLLAISEKLDYAIVNYIKSSSR
ncbi:hypothetical protein D2A34_23345 [Clostridium chromiireducens]|uniref:Spo0E like sporulation regulatory protein n=1 Tax=Clostridium chromiireducens TaxID=225345 RepID=A0A399IHX5_9CLOT|nr:hypothetical protein [Clostridium chromiireducens]RII32603.1 hypothetical protein D2A34_23345 [Clostridium chromiireducens]